jgi:hypothetical protein
MPITMPKLNNAPKRIVPSSVSRFILRVIRFGFFISKWITFPPPKMAYLMALYRPQILASNLVITQIKASYEAIVFCKLPA